MMKERVILAANDFNRNGAANGGQRRTQQFHELIARAGFDLQFPPDPERVSDLKKYFLGLRHCLQSGARAAMNWRLLRRHGAVIARYDNWLRTSTTRNLLFWEKTVPVDLVIPFLGKQHGHSIVAGPHNLEAIAHQHELRSSRDQALKRELAALAVSDAVFTISEQEQWLLALFDIPSIFLPYYPPAPVRDFLRSVREARAGTEQAYWLVLGTVANVPTYVGVCELLSWAKKFPCGATLPLHIAGYETERLQPETSGTHWVIHGSVSQAELTQLLSGAKAVLVHQRAGAGALTRIPEMLMAGIPVFANRMAARSNASPGVYVYDTPQELYGLMQRKELPCPPPPAAPAAEQQFIDCLKNVAQPR